MSPRLARPLPGSIAPLRLSAALPLSSMSASFARSLASWVGRPLAISLAFSLVLALSLQPALADCDGVETVIPAGVPDSFTPPSEPTTPSWEFLTYMQQHWPQPPSRQFDDLGADWTLIHTFSGWSGPVCGATLEIRLAASTSSLSFNDSVRLAWVGGDDLFHAFLYWVEIRIVTGTWGPGSDATITLDLAALPPYEDFPTNILDQLADGFLELAVEDDTAVDYAVLTVCQCPVPVEEGSWGRVKATYLPSITTRRVID